MACIGGSLLLSDAIVPGIAFTACGLIVFANYDSSNHQLKNRKIRESNRAKPMEKLQLIEKCAKLSNCISSIDQ